MAQVKDQQQNIVRVPGKAKKIRNLRKSLENLKKKLKKLLRN